MVTITTLASVIFALVSVCVVPADGSVMSSLV